MAGKPGREIRAEIDAENARGLVIANGGAAAALVAFLPQVLEKPAFDSLTRAVLVALAIFVLGLAFAFVHNRLRRKCSLEFENHGMSPPPCRFLGQYQEPCVCLASTGCMWAATAAFLLGSLLVIFGTMYYVDHRGGAPATSAAPPKGH